MITERTMKLFLCKEEISIVLNGKFKLTFPGIGGQAGINHYINQNGYWEINDSYAMTSMGKEKTALKTEPELWQILTWVIF